MENSFSWEASALLGMAGAWLLVGPASSRLGRFSSIAALLLFIAAVFDLWLGDRTAVAPLAPWSGALVLWGLSLDLVRAQAAPASSTSIDVDKDVDQDVGKEVEVRADESWLQGLAGLQDAIALLNIIAYLPTSPGNVSLPPPVPAPNGSNPNGRKSSGSSHY